MRRQEGARDLLFSIADLSNCLRKVETKSELMIRVRDAGAVAFGRKRGCGVGLGGHGFKDRTMRSAGQTKIYSFFSERSEASFFLASRSLRFNLRDRSNVSP